MPSDRFGDGISPSSAERETTTRRQNLEDPNQRQSLRIPVGRVAGPHRRPVAADIFNHDRRDTMKLKTDVKAGLAPFSDPDG